MSREHEHLDDTELLLALDGDVAASRRFVVAGHLARCGRCRARQDEIARALDEAATAARPGDQAWSIPRPYGTGETERDGDSAWLGATRQKLIDALDASGEPAARAGRWHGRMQWAAAAAAILLALLTWRSGVDGAFSRPGRGIAERWPVLPMAVLTPGAVAITSAEQVCSGVTPSRLVTDQVRREVLRSYRMEAVPGREFELDALITPELGGSVDARNLWPQRYASPVWNARVKDQLEERLPQLVCRGEVDLAMAQRDIAVNWIAAYRKYLKTSVPLPTADARTDGDELQFEPPKEFVLADSRATLPTMLRRIR